MAENFIRKRPFVKVANLAVGFLLGFTGLVGGSIAWRTISNDFATTLNSLTILSLRKVL